MKLPLTLTLAISMAASASAAIIIDYDSANQAGGNMSQPTVVQDNVELGGGSADDQQTRITLAQNSPNTWSSTGSGYNGPDYSLVWDGIAYNEGANWDSRDSNPLSIRAQMTGSDIGGVPGKDGAGNFHLAVIFDYAGSATLDATSSLFADFSRFENLGAVRWLVRDGSTYYLSQATLGSGANTLDNGAGLLTTNWAVYDPASGADFDQGSATFTTLTTAFTDLNAFGVMADKDAITSVRHWFEMKDFTVDAVPEPSAFAVVLGLAGLFAVLRRRR